MMLPTLFPGSASRIWGPTLFVLLALLHYTTPLYAQYPTHQKISDTQGGFTGTLDNSDFMGFSVALLGDLDGDGTQDLATGALGDNDGGTDRGAVWILFLNADGTVKSHQKISDTEGGFTGILDDVDYFGSSITSLGDLDGDGTTDLAVGAMGDDGSGTGRGAVWILFLNPDGTVKSHQKIADAQGGFTGILDDSDSFGRSVIALGDLDSDGTADLAVGASNDDDGGDGRGAVWILFLNLDGTVKSHQKISDTQGGFTGILDNADEFGGSITAPRDLDGGVLGAIAVGALGDDDGSGMGRGAIWILFLNPDGTVESHQKISDTQGGFTGILNTGDLFGSSITALGDLDGDGTQDLAVGALGDDDGGMGRGAVWILYLNSNGTVKNHQKISDTQGGFTGILDDNDQFGISVTTLGDLDSDGTVDLAVGAYLDDDDNTESGAVWILFRQNPGLTLTRSSNPPLETGDTFTLNLKAGTAAYPVVDLFGVGVKLNYDPTLLRVDAIQISAFLDNGNLLFFDDIDNVNGVASATVSRRQGDGGVDGQGIVLSYTMTVLGSAHATLTLSDALFTFDPTAKLVPHTESLALPLYSGFVWPGDTDDNGTVAVADLLPIGTHFDGTGPARSDQDIDWSPKGVVGTWSPSGASYADATGDGLVSQNDVLPVGVNFGNTLSAPDQQGPTAKATSAPKALAASAVAAAPYRLRVYHNRHKQQARARLVLLDAEDLLGVATTLHFDPAVYQLRSHTPGLLLDDGDLLSLDDEQDGQLAVAYTRKAPNGAVTGRGPVLDVLFDVIGEPHDEAMTLQTLTLGTTEGSIAVVGPDAVAARAELGLDTAPAEPAAAKAEDEAPVSFALTGAYPNPFNPATTIAFDLPDRADVSLIVVDLLGREVRRLDVGTLAAGAGQTVRFVADGLPSGVYLYRIEARTSEALHMASGRFTLLK